MPIADVPSAALLDATNRLVGLGSILCAAYLAWTFVRRRVRLRRRRSSAVVAATGPLARLCFIGFATALSSFPTAAASSAAQPLLRTQREPRPPWLGDRGAPPPRALLRAEVVDLPVKGATPTEKVHVHPAIHPGRPRTTRLFPRANGSAVRSPVEQAERLRSMARHPSGKDLEAEDDEYTVAPGDTLWDIAARRLQTDDPRRIAAYWPKLHRANRAVLGRDPHLIRPGQSLRFPSE